jgi:peptidoglycan hydrolase CwlO-like protein
MWKKLCVSLVLCALAFLSAGFCGTCYANQTYQISEIELLTLEQNLTTLEQNNETLKSILTAQGSELTEALNLLTKSQEELARLRNELKACKNDLNLSQESLKIANDELAKAAQSFKQYEKERDKVEGRLRNQRNIWEVLCAIAVGVAVAR